ncbi:hypothetical protein [Streptomyces sp. NPDC005322]|uniref:hypothetical protein n=1 Tax=Streptomyces sp. NPDC005322 TaxID=3157032 RepID=UPI0033A791DE
MTSTVPRRLARKAGVDLPVLGLGTWRTIDRAGPDRLADLLGAARTVGARLVDTAPVYSDAEPVPLEKSSLHVMLHVCIR